MSTLDDLREAVAKLRDTRRMPTRGRALYELNIWKGEQRKALDEEYERRLAEIEAEPEPTIEDQVSPAVLSLVAKAVAEGVSRSNIRRALGKTTLDETDEIIQLATRQQHELVAKGEVASFTLRPTGHIHAKGWPMYEVTLLDEQETYSSVYLVTANAVEVERRHLRILPSPAGSSDILDRIFASGAAAEIFARGKD